MGFGQRVNEVLLARGLTPADLSRELGWNTGALSQYMNNPDRSPKLSTAIKIADALDVSIDWLAGREGFDMHGRIDPKRAQYSPEEKKLVDDYRNTMPSWQRTISEQAANAAKDHPKTEADGTERRAS